MNAENNVSLVKFIEDESVRNLKKAGQVWKVGGVLLVILASYMIWIATSISSFFNPTELGVAVAGNIDSTVPDYLAQFDGYIRGQAPVLAQDLSKEAFELVKTVRSQGEEGVDHAFDLLVALRGELDHTINTHFEAHGPEIKDFYEAHRYEDISKLVVGDLMTNIGGSLDALLRGEEDQQGWPEIKQASLETLKSINMNLEKLAKTPAGNLTKVQQAQRRVIAAWVHALNHEFKDQRIDLMKLSDEG